MNAQQFLAEFGHIANAPGGIDRLRDLVLELAIQGRLVPPVDSGECVRDLLEHIRKQRSLHIERTPRRRSVNLPDIEKSEEPFDLPAHWVWVRNAELFGLLKGKNPKDLGAMGKYSYLDIEALDRGNILRYTSDERVPRVSKTDILVVCDGSRSGLVLKGQDGVIGSTLARIDTAEFIQPFIWMMFQHSYRRLNAEKKGAAIPHLDTARLLRQVCGLPPLAEQALIVAKVDELMALCDKLEAQQQERRKLQNALRLSTLQAVAASTSPFELQTTWARLAENFGQLFSAPDDVDQFVAELKNMAVRGLLSLPSTSTPAVDEIVANCDDLRDQYIESGLMRRQKIIAVTETDVIFPEHWAIAPFDKVAVVIGGVTKGRDLRGRTVITCPYLAVANVQRGFFKLHGLKTIQIGIEELNKYLVKEGDLLITEGGDWDKVGRTAIWRGGVESCLHQNHVFKARVPSQWLLNEWVELVFNSGVGRDYFAGASKQTTNLASINMTQLRSFPMPIPPLDEQREILGKLDALTAQAGVWREQLKRKQHLASLFAGATLAALTGIAAEQQEKPVKIPQTELIAPLKLGKEPDIKVQAPLAIMLARHNGEMAARDLWQRFGGEIDAFYAQLKTEVAHGWILEPCVAEMREKLTEKANA